MVWKSLMARLHRQPPQPGGVGDMLTGHFDVRGNRIAGTASAASTRTLKAVEIRVQRRGQTIVRCQAAIDPDGQRCSFTFPIDNQFTLRELVDEDVFVTAWNERGDNGTLSLDGATQLELIREHLGSPVATEFDIDFTRGGNSTSYCISGWSQPETDFTWTEGDDSLMHVPAPQVAGAYVLRITTGAILRKPELSRQDMDVFVNGAFAGHLSQTEAFMQFSEIKFHSDLFAGRPSAELRFHHPDAVRPCDFGDSKDTRRLAFSFKRLSLVRPLEPDSSS